LGQIGGCLNCGDAWVFPWTLTLVDFWSRETFTYLVEGFFFRCQERGQLIASSCGIDFAFVLFVLLLYGLLVKKQNASLFSLFSLEPETRHEVEWKT
jgi:hypothetical protein